jgi:ankyrin repeat protein
MRKLLLGTLIIVCGASTMWHWRPFRPVGDELLLVGMAGQQRAWVNDALATGASPNSCDGFGITPLMWAAIDGDAPMVGRLLGSGANPSARSHTGMTALAYAAFYGHVDTMNALIDAGADVNERTLDDGTPLHDAVAMQQLDAVRILIDRGAVVDARDSFGQTPLIKAAWRGSCSIPVIQYLIASGANVAAQENDGHNAWTCAIAEDAADLAELLHDATPNDQEAPSLVGSTPVR